MSQGVSTAWGVCAVLAAAVLLVAGPGTATAAPGDTALVDRADGLTGDAGNGVQSSMAISADGRYMAFRSAATNLSPDDDDTLNDIFWRDLETGTTLLVSRADGVSGEKGDLASFGPAISADGRYVAFHTSSDNIDPGDVDDNGDVYLRDVVTAQTELISVSSSEENANANAANGSVSADGSRVAFQSTASNLHPDDTGGTSLAENDIFVRDRTAGDTLYASRADTASGAQGNERSTSSSISSDGTRVAFETMATNFDEDDDDSASDAYVRDLAAGTTMLVSRADGPAGTPANASIHTGQVRISADGGSVAFLTGSDNLDPDATEELVVRGFIRHLATNETDLVTRADGEGSPPAALPVDVISAPGGTRIAFVSAGPGWTDESPPGASDDRVYVRDWGAGTTRLESKADGLGSDQVVGSPSQVVLSQDGLFVGFTSSTPNVVPGVADGLSHLYRRELPGPTACADAQAALEKAKKKVRKAKAQVRKTKKKLKKAKKSGASASKIKKLKKKVKKNKAKLKRAKQKVKAAKADVGLLC